MTSAKGQRERERERKYTPAQTQRFREDVREEKKKILLGPFTVSLLHFHLMTYSLFVEFFIKATTLIIVSQVELNFS